MNKLTIDSANGGMRDDFFVEVYKWYSAKSDAGKIQHRFPTATYHQLSYDLERFVIQKRSEHINPRVELLTRDERKEDELDLLRTDGEGEQMLFLGGLLRELKSQNPELSDKDAIVAVALVGGHCARIDSNAAAAARVWDWSINEAGKGWHPKTIASLRVIERFAEADSTDALQSGNRLLTDFQEVVRESLAQLESSGDDCEKIDTYLFDRHQWLLLQLTEILASLPATVLRQKVQENGQDEHVLGEAWLIQALPWFPSGHNKPLFHQHYARILLALGRLSDAREEIGLALKHAKPHMLQSIEASRRMQLAIDLEDISRADIAEKVTEEATVQATSAATANVQKVAMKEREKTNDDISNALVRVVEVLGIFLGVAGIAITAVGGIVVEGSFWNRALIWGLGYGGVVSLFWLLRMVAGLPGARRMIRDRKKIRSLEAALDAKATSEDLKKDAGSSANVARESE